MTTQSADSLIGSTARGKDYVRITIENKGGILLPIQMGVTYSDGTSELIKLPADAWRTNELKHTYGFFTNKTVVKVVVDPNEVFADVNRDNNTWSSEKPGVS